MEFIIGRFKLSQTFVEHFVDSCWRLWFGFSVLIGWYWFLSCSRFDGVLSDLEIVESPYCQHFLQKMDFWHLDWFWSEPEFLGMAISSFLHFVWFLVVEMFETCLPSFDFWCWWSISEPIWRLAPCSDLLRHLPPLVRTGPAYLRCHHHRRFVHQQTRWYPSCSCLRPQALTFDSDFDWLFSDFGWACVRLPATVIEWLYSLVCFIEQFELLEACSWSGRSWLDDFIYFGSLVDFVEIMLPVDLIGFHPGFSTQPRPYELPVLLASLLLFVLPLM